MLDNQELIAHLKKYGIFVGLVAGMVAILLTVILISQGSWKRGLAVNMQDALNTFYPDTYVVGSYLPLKTPMSSSAAVYTVTKKKVTDSISLHCYGVIVRIPTIAGPAPAIFLYTKDRGTDFIGYALPYGKASTVFESSIGLKIIQYWQKQVEQILAACGVEVDA